MNRDKLKEIFEYTINQYCTVHEQIKHTTDDKRIKDIDNMGGMRKYMDTFKNNAAKPVFMLIEDCADMEEFKKNLDMWADNNDALIKLNNNKNKLTFKRIVFRLLRKVSKLDTQFRQNFRDVLLINIRDMYENN